MRRSDAITPAKQALGVAAAGLALLDATAGEARARPIEGVRLAQSPAPATSGDSYQDGRALLAAGDFAGAIAAFRAALLVAPQSVDALNGLGVAYDRIGRYDISRSYYDTALAIDPSAVLVLNNLGYSLYLQGAYDQAIPLLQQVAGSDDPAAQRAAQRVLTMVATRMREDAIADRASVSVAATNPAATVQIDAPRARIEVTASGEQRLVLGAPAPDAALAATLGDAAPLVLVAKAWTPRDEAVLAAREAAADRAADMAARAAMAEQLAAALAAARQPAEATAIPDRAPAPAVALMAVSARRRSAGSATGSGERPGYLAPQTAIALTAALSTRFAAMLQEVDGAIDAAARRAADGGNRRTRPMVNAAELTAAAGFAPDIASDDDASPWLLASRRAPRTEVPAIIAGNAPDTDARNSFDSDDDDLNAFAARMRGIDAPPATGPVSVEMAVARLEALLRRLRAA